MTFCPLISPRSNCSPPAMLREAPSVPISSAIYTNYSITKINSARRYLIYLVTRVEAERELFLLFSPLDKSFDLKQTKHKERTGKNRVTQQSWQLGKSLEQVERGRKKSQGESTYHISPTLSPPLERTHIAEFFFWFLILVSFAFVTREFIWHSNNCALSLSAGFLRETLLYYYYFFLLLPRRDRWCPYAVLGNSKTGTTTYPKKKKSSSWTTLYSVVWWQHSSMNLIRQHGQTFPLCNK